MRFTLKLCCHHVAFVSTFCGDEGHILRGKTRQIAVRWSGKDWTRTLVINKGGFMWRLKLFSYQMILSHITVVLITAVALAFLIVGVLQ